MTKEKKISKNMDDEGNIYESPEWWENRFNKYPKYLWSKMGSEIRSSGTNHEERIFFSGISATVHRGMGYPCVSIYVHENMESRISNPWSLKFCLDNLKSATGGLAAIENINKTLHKFCHKFETEVLKQEKMAKDERDLQIEKLVAIWGKEK